MDAGPNKVQNEVASPLHLHTCFQFGHTGQGLKTLHWQSTEVTETWLPFFLYSRDGVGSSIYETEASNEPTSPPPNDR